MRHFLRENIVTNLEKLRTFYHLVKEGSYAAASRVLNKTRSTITIQVRDLELEYKKKLFTIERKNIHLTEDGKKLYDIIHQHVPNFETSLNDIFKEKKEETKRLKIVTTGGLIGIWVVEKLEKLIREFPEIEISVHATNSDINFSEFPADVGILQKRHETSVSQRKVLTIENKLYASRGYIEKYGEPKQLSDLSQHKLITFYSGQEYNLGNVDWHTKRGMPKETARSSSLKINSAFLILEAARKGLGIISIWEDFPYMREYNLVQILPNEPPQKFEIYYITRKDLILNAVQKRFLDILMDKSEIEGEPNKDVV